MASAASAAERQRLNLPAGTLGEALVALGRQTGISIGVTDPALARERVRAVNGALTVDEALARLLRGTNGRALRVDSSTIRVVRRPPVRRVAPAPPPVPEPPPPRRAAPRPLPSPPVSAPQIEQEIVVTASRRLVPLRSYPGSVAIVGSDDPALTDSIRGSDALVARLPAVGSTYLGSGRNKLFIRGISDSSFHGPTQATVGQYLGENRLTYTSPDPDLRLFDVERVEILSGPQGTLYGAGSLGGIVRIVPNAPALDRLEGSVQAGGAWTQHGDPGFEGAAVVNLPIAQDRLGLRLSGYYAREGGYIDDLERGLDDVNRVRIAGGRATLRVAPDDDWTVDLGATVQRIRSDDAQYSVPAVGRLARRTSFQQGSANDYALASITAAKEIGGTRLTMSAGMVRQALRERYDATRPGIEPVAYDLTTRAAMYSAEMRVSRRGDDGAGWLGGISLVLNRSDQRRDVEFAASGYARNRVANDVSEGALYGEAAFRLAPAIVASLGGRVAYTRLSTSAAAGLPGLPFFPVPVAAATSDATFLPSAAISARAREDVLLYARYQEGFRPGGLAFLGAEPRRFDADRMRSAEAGIRFGAPGSGAFDASAAFVYTSWSDIQADTLDGGGDPTITNVGDGRIATLDLSVGWRPVRSLAIEAAAVFNDSRVTRLASPELAGPSLSLPSVARMSGRLAAHWTPLVSDSAALRLTAMGRYVGRSRFGLGPVFGHEQGEWLDVGLSMRADWARHSLTLGISNLLDSARNRFAYGSPFTLAIRSDSTPMRPRSVRLGWQLRF